MRWNTTPTLVKSYVCSSFFSHAYTHFYVSVRWGGVPVHHRRSIKTKEKECRTNHLAHKDDLKRKFLVEHPFWYRVVCVNRRIIHNFKASIPPNSLYSIHPFLQNNPGGKYLVRQGIESIPSSQTAAMTFAFSSVFILLLSSIQYIEYKLHEKVRIF